MRQNQDTVFLMLKISKAEEVLKSGCLSPKQESALKAFIKDASTRVPPSMMAHIQRIKTPSVCGVGIVRNCACSVCGASLPEDELAYLADKSNVGLCENCFSFLVADYPPDYYTFIKDIFASCNEC